LSNTKGASGLAPRGNAPPGISTSPGNGPPPISNGVEFSPLTEEEITKKLLQDGMALEEAKQRALLGKGSLKQAMETDIALVGQIETELKELGFRPVPSQIFKTAENWTDDDEKLPQLLGILNHLWHQKITAEPGGARPEALKQWDAIQSAQRGLEAYANKQLLIENLLFQLTNG